MRARMIVSGVVQGVGFRWFTQRAANQLNLAGWVHNEPNGSVSAEVEGDAGLVKDFIHELKAGNRYAHVNRIDETPVNVEHDQPPFVIRY